LVALHNTVASAVKILLIVDEAAHALGIHRTFLYTRLLESGELSSVKVGNRRLVPVQSLYEYVERLVAQQKAS
jgi:excisionase family DNA binding protein